MAFMKRDVNFGLLILIIVSILLFSGFSVYYQTTFKDVSLEYKGKLEQLSKVTKELGAKRQELNETYNLKIKAETDRKVLDERYKDVSDERNRLEDDKSKLQSELITTKSDLATKSVELSSTKNLLAQTEASLITANNEIKSKNNKINNLNEEIDCLETEAGKADADEDMNSC